MADYDLIILGGAPVGRYAALRACKLGARVALIEPAVGPTAALPDYLSQINRYWPQGCQSNWQSAGLALPDWATLRGRAEQIAQRRAASIAVPDSLPHLMTAGVEVILAEAAFQKPNPRLRLGVAVDQRLLRARAYLLAPAAIAPPNIPGLTQVRPWTDWPRLPNQIVIWGDDPQRVWLAQILNRLGAQVTLIGGAFLPQADPEAERLLQLQLEAEGVTVLTQAEVTQVQQLGSQVLLQVGEQPGGQTIEADALLLAHSRLALASLNLAAAGVQWQPDQILVNRRLQTTQPRIYACNPTHSLSHLAQADTALRHALGLALGWTDRRLQVQRWSLPTNPEVVCLGLTEPQAMQRYGAAVRIGVRPLKQVSSAQIQSDAIGFVKLIAANGRILGAHAVGAGAGNWMGEVALAIQQNLKLSAVASGSPLSPVSELIQQIAVEMQDQQRPNWQRDFLETWFDLRRSR